MSSVVVVVDTDRSFVDELELFLSREGLAADYRVQWVAPKVNLEPGPLVEQVVAEVKALGGRPSVFFIDLWVYENKRSDMLGREIANSLRRVHPSAAIFIYTAKFWTQQGEALFAFATISDADGVFPRGFITGDDSSRRRWLTVLEEAGRRRRAVVGAGVAQREAGSSFKLTSTDFADGVREVVRTVGRDEVEAILGQLFPRGEGVLLPLSPGRSGALVLIVEAQSRNDAGTVIGPKKWVVKFDRESDRLKREIGAYDDAVRSPLRSECLPRILSGEPVLGQGGWAAIAVELQGEAMTLWDCLSGGKGAPDDLAQALVSALASMWGDPVQRTSTAWDPFFSLAEARGAVLGALASLVKEVPDVISELDVRRLGAFVRTNGDSEPKFRDATCRFDLRNVHGDLNCRNVLVRSDQRDVVFIDLASRRVAPFVVDVAKLERDLVLRVWDHGSRRYSDWNSLPEWLSYREVVEATDGERWVEGLDERLRGVARFILEFRRRALERGVATADQYSRALLFFFCLGIALPDLPIQKRVLAVRVASVLLAVCAGAQ